MSERTAKLSDPSGKQIIMPPRKDTKKPKTPKTPGKPGRKPKEEAVQMPQTFTFRISESVRKQLQQRAEIEHSSESAVCNRILEQGLSENMQSRLEGMEERLRRLESEPRQIALITGSSKDDVLALFDHTPRKQPVAARVVDLEEVDDATSTEDEPEPDGESTDEADGDDGTLEDTEIAA